MRTSPLRRVMRSAGASITAAVFLVPVATAAHNPGFGHQNPQGAADTQASCNFDAACLLVSNFNAGPTARAVTGEHLAGGTAPGVYGLTTSTAAEAEAIRGEIISDAPGAGSVGLSGLNNGTGGLGIGVRGEHEGSGYGVYGTTVNGRGVYGFNSGPASSGTNAAVYGLNSSDAPIAAGVYGNITSAASYSAGVRGRNGSGAFGGFGVFGEHAGNGIGVYGEALDGFAVSGFSPDNWSGYFQGSVRVVGNLQKNSGSFTIDHPLDPANKYLSHSFVESPDMLNVYNGNVRTDKRGFATVKLPRYFQALNRDFRYQLTIVGRRGWNARVVKRIKNNQFTIESDQARVEVSWQVTGIRKDAWANAHRIKVEEAKTGSEAGKYLNPELYGKPLTKSVVMLPGMGKAAAARSERRVNP